MLDDEVPQLDVASLQRLVGLGVAHERRQRQLKPALADVGAADRQNSDSGAQRLVRYPRGDVIGVRRDGLKAVDAGERPDNRQRIESTQRLSAPGMRVVGDAVAASDHRAIFYLIGKSEPRSEELLAVAQAVVLGNATLPAYQHFVGRGIIQFDAQALGALPGGVNFPAHSELEGQLWSKAPAVAHVETPRVFEAVHLDELAALARGRGRTKQKRRHAVPTVLERGSASGESDSGADGRGVQGRNAITETEPAPRPLA